MIVNITETLRIFTGEAFFNCNISFNVVKSSLFALYEGNVYDSTYKTLVAVSYSTKELVFHPNTKAIGHCAFSTSSLEHLIVNNNISLDNYAIHAARCLRTLVIESYITKLNSDALNDMPNLESIWLPDSLVDFKVNSLQEMEKLQTIRVSDKIASAEPGSFVLCENIRFVHSLNIHKINVLWNSGIPKRALQLSKSTAMCNLFGYSFSVTDLSIISMSLLK